MNDEVNEAHYKRTSKVNKSKHHYAQCRLRLTPPHTTILLRPNQDAVWTVDGVFTRTYVGGTHFLPEPGQARRSPFAPINKRP